MNYYEKDFYIIMKEYLINEYVNDEYWNQQFEDFKDEDNEIQFDNYKQAILEHIGGSFPYYSLSQTFMNENKLNTIDYTDMIEYLVDEEGFEYNICIDMCKVITQTLTYIFIENESVLYKKYLDEVVEYQNMLKEIVVS